jgi:hypothetical protein
VAVLHESVLAQVPLAADALPAHFPSVEVAVEFWRRVWAASRPIAPISAAPVSTTAPL